VHTRSADVFFPGSRRTSAIPTMRRR
jgi:hypothetical protein